MPRPLLSDDEKKKRKKEYDLRYQKKRYATDENYREKIKNNSNQYYQRKINN